MPILLLSPRYSNDSNNLRRVALAAGWRVERVVRWQLPEGLEGEHVVLYGEPLFGEFVMERLGLALLEPTFDEKGAHQRELTVLV